MPILDVEMPLGGALVLPLVLQWAWRAKAGMENMEDYTLDGHAREQLDSMRKSIQQINNLDLNKYKVLYGEAATSALLDNAITALKDRIATRFALHATALKNFSLSHAKLITNLLATESLINIKKMADGDLDSGTMGKLFSACRQASCRSVINSHKEFELSWAEVKALSEIPEAKVDTAGLSELLDTKHASTMVAVMTTVIALMRPCKKEETRAQLATKCRLMLIKMDLNTLPPNLDKLLKDAHGPIPGVPKIDAEKA